MVFVSLIAALLIEQGRPLQSGNHVHQWFARYAAWLEQKLNAAQHHHGAIAWSAAMLPTVLAAALAYWSLHSASAVLAWIFNVAILYLTLGFRQFSHSYTAIAEALRSNDVARARAVLASWSGQDADALEA